MKKKKEEVKSVRSSADVPKLIKPPNPPKQAKLLTPEEVSKYKPTASPVDHSANIQQVMGIGLGATFDIAIEQEAVVVAKVTHKHNKLGDVETLPKPVKKK